MLKRLIEILCFLALVAVVILISLVIAKWIWGTDLPEWLKVLMIAG